MNIQFEAVVTGKRMEPTSGLWSTEVSVRSLTAYPSHMTFTVNKDLPIDAKLLLILTDEQDYDPHDVITFRPEVK